MSAVMRIACEGLTCHEQGVLSQQLRMLSGRTEQSWIQVADSEDADLLIVRGATEREGQAFVQRRVGMRFEPVGRVGWPIRLFVLLDMLVACEKRPRPNEIGGAEHCEHLAGLSPLNFYRVGEDVIIFPGKDLVFARTADFDTVLQLLDETRQVPTAEKLVPLDELSLFAHCFSFKRLLWSLSLRHGEQVGRQWQAESTTFRLGAWPLLGEWQSEPPMLRLAALYTRRFASLERGVTFSGASREQVQAFLFACKCCGLGVETLIEQPAATLRPSSERSLLQRLRQRLGLGYGKEKQK